MEASWLTDIVVVLKTDTLFTVQKYVCISPSVSLSLCCVSVCVWWCGVCVVVLCVCVCICVWKHYKYCSLNTSGIANRLFLLQLSRSSCGCGCNKKIFLKKRVPPTQGRSLRSSCCVLHKSFGPDMAGWWSCRHWRTHARQTDNQLEK